MGEEVELKIFLLIIWIHFISDFVLQIDKMSLNKSKSLYWLGVHSIIYGILFLYFGWIYALVNSILHFIVDGITSRINKRLLLLESKHWFFVGIGFDQAIHLTLLLISYKLICK